MPDREVQEDANVLKGWTAIAKYLRIPPSTAQRWAKDGMPVRREGRYAVADPKELSEWLGREARMPGPAQVMTDEADVAGALRASIATRRSQKRH